MLEFSHVQISVGSWGTQHQICVEGWGTIHPMVIR